VDDFQEQASSAWAQLVESINTGLQQLSPGQQQQQQQPDGQQHPEQQQHPKHPKLLDLSGLAVPILARRRLTGPVLLVPEPQDVPPGVTPKQAADAAIAAAQQAQLLFHQQQQCTEEDGGGGLPDPPMPALLVPPGCLALHSWHEAATAAEPPGTVASDLTEVPGGAVAAAAPGDGAAAGGRAGSGALALPPPPGRDADALLQPGSEVVITLVVLENSRRLHVPQQEIQVRERLPGKDSQEQGCRVGRRTCAPFDTPPLSLVSTQA
jgi:hypothetical protein